ncbi:MAG: formylglycine-generating enzyme family protein [Leptothrix ochracea]|uniref:formylglycine-generating enzyme family protein n=1 Tax=Leptothrix ochracea TaxID=735331 RepID=UPI0034E2BDC0
MSCRHQQVVRIFLASPSADTHEARARVVAVVDEINADLQYNVHVRLDLRRWDDPVRPVICDRSGNPQQNVVKQAADPADCDLVIGLLANTMGGTLPTDRFPPPTGHKEPWHCTEWEIEQGLSAKRAVWVFHDQRPPPSKKPDVMKAAMAVSQYINRFNPPDGPMREGYNPFNDEEDLAARLRTGLRDWLSREFITTNPPSAPNSDRHDQRIHAHLTAPVERLAQHEPRYVPLPFLGLLQGVSWADGEPPPPALLDALTGPLAEQANPGLPPEALLPPDVCPWVGLAAFQKEQARRFFGRERDVRAALNLLGRAPDTASLALVEGQPPGAIGSGTLSGSTAPYRRWLHIVGGSGSGKSSLMRAGLLPLVEQGELSARTGLDEWIVTAPMLPGTEPLVALAEVLAPALGQSSLTLLRKLRDGQEPETLRLWLRDAPRQRQNPRGVLLVIDQFEELFTLSPVATRQRLDVLLHAALTAPASPLHLVSTCRSDYQHHIAEDLPHLAGLLNTLSSLYTLTPMDAGGLRQAITGPAGLGRVRVQPDLVQALLDDAAEDPAAALPLVQHAMETLWRHRRRAANAPAELILADFDALGRLGGILATEADRLLASLGHDGSPQHKGALELLSALAHFHPEGRHTRQSLTWDQACRQAGQGFAPADLARGQKVLDALSGQRQDGADQTARLRLLTLSGSAADKDSGDTRRIDLIHEALLRSRPGSRPADPARPYWPRLVDYLTTHKDRDLLRQNLRDEAEKWQGWGRYTRLLDAPALGTLRRYRAVQYLATQDENTYLQAARRMARGRAALGWSSLALFAALILLMVFQADIARWLKTDEGWDTVMALRWGWRSAPMPQTEPVPPGEFDYGCKPGRDDQGGIQCPKNEAWRHVDLRRKQHANEKDRCTAFGKYEVTLAEYDYYIWQQRRTTPAGAIKPSYVAQPVMDSAWNWRPGNLAVVNVSWQAATAYTQWLHQQTDQPWRLPTEEEWEYAARAPGHGGVEAAFWWGPDLPKEAPGQPPRANCEGCDARYQHRIAPVGSYAANPFGLHDTAGGAWEWTSSADTPDNQPAATEADDQNSWRVLRGGSWDFFPGNLRASIRSSVHPDYRYYNIGFRVCRASPISEGPDAGATDR